MWREVGAVQCVWGGVSAPPLPLSMAVRGMAACRLCSLYDTPLKSPGSHIPTPATVPLVAWLDRATADSQANSWPSQAWPQPLAAADGASSRAGPDRMGEPKVTRLPSRHLPAKASPAGVKLIRRVCGESGAPSLRVPSPAAAWSCHPDLCFLRPPAYSNLRALASTLKRGPAVWASTSHVHMCTVACTRACIMQLLQCKCLCVHCVQAMWLE